MRKSDGQGSEVYRDLHSIHVILNVRVISLVLPDHPEDVQNIELSEFCDTFCHSLNFRDEILLDVVDLCNPGLSSLATGLIPCKIFKRGMVLLIR